MPRLALTCSTGLMLSQDEQATLRQILQLADRHLLIAERLKASVETCLSNQSLKGLDDMVAFSFNAQQHTPQYGGGGGLPAGPNGEPVKYKVVIVNSSQENVEKNNMVVGGYLALELTPIEGPLQGTKHTDRLNLHHTNPKTVEIANKQLSAYCHVLNKFQFNDTAELHNIPFVVEIGLQKAPNPNGYTEVKAIFDVNGNEPGKAGNGPQVQQQQPNIPNQPAGGVQAQGNGWGGAPQDQGQPQGGGFGGGQPQGGQPQGGGWGQQGGAQPDPNAGAQGGGWGGQPQGGQPQGGQPQHGGIDNNVAMPGQGQPQGGGFPQGGGQPQGQPQGGAQGWGGQPQGGQPQGQPQGGGGWQQGGAPAGGGQPQWGQR